MSLYDRVADLPLEVEDWEVERRERDTSSGFTRVTTVVRLRGEGTVGEGEDVTYEPEAHDALPDIEGGLDLPGEYAFEEFSGHLAGADLFPGGGPGTERSRHYRRWAFESAALDLALRQAGTHLGARLDREYDPVRFVVSTRLGDPPTADRVREWLDIDPAIEFKLDATPEWPPELMDELAATDRVRVLDLKAHYEDPEVGTEVDPDFYRDLFEAFPGAVIEDAGITEVTRPILADARERLSWDLPIEGLDDVRDLPWEPRWLNVKPSRFGTVRSLFETIEYCLDAGIGLYGGGQFELGPGRGQIQLLASLFYPEGPNDVAPRAYNDPGVGEGLPSSPLAAPRGVTGFRWERPA